MKVQMERFVDYATGDQMDSKYVRIKPIDTDSIRHTFQDFSLDDDRYRIHPRDFVLPSPIDDTYEA